MTPPSEYVTAIKINWQNALAGLWTPPSLSASPMYMPDINIAMKNRLCYFENRYISTASRQFLYVTEPMVS